MFVTSELARIYKIDHSIENFRLLYQLKFRMENLSTQNYVYAFFFFTGPKPRRKPQKPPVQVDDSEIRGN